MVASKSNKTKPKAVLPEKAKAKPKIPKKVKIPKKIKPKIKVITVWQTYKLAWLELSTFWRHLLGVIAVYAVLSFIFVASFALLPSTENLAGQIETTLGADYGRFFNAVTLVGLSVYEYSSPGNTVMQVFLFLLASTAFIWAIRKQRGLKDFYVRQAYYEGPANFVPLILVCTMLLLTLVPASLGSTALSFGLQISGSLIERIILYIFAFGSVSLSVYWMAVWWPAFYIVMLPGTKPIASMRAAADLTKGVRMKIFIRHIVLSLSLVLIFFTVVIPVSLIWQRIIPVTVYVVLFALFGVMHTLFFSLYRSLVDEKQA